MLDTLLKIKELIEQNRVLEKRNEELKNLVDINLNKQAETSSVLPSDILGKQEIESLVFKFFQQYKVPSAVYDKDGKLLFSIGWKRLCSNQVKHNATAPCCEEGVTQFIHIKPAEKYYHHQCNHGFNALGFPIEIKSKTFGMLVISQFFNYGQIPGVDAFKDWKDYQPFNEDNFSLLLAEIPVIKPSELENIISQGTLLAEMISFIGNKNLEFYKRFNHQLENEQLFNAIKIKLAEQEQIIQSLISKITQHHDYVQEHTIDKSTLKKEIKSLTGRLDHTETILNSILTSIPLGITFVKKNTITYANDQIYKITGYTIKELIGRNPGYIIADQNVWKEILSLTSESFIEKEKTTFEIILNKKDKTTCTALAFVSPHDINNPQNGFTLSFLDISETKNIQAQLLDAKERAEDADKMKNAFLLNMSHDIRSPLSTILGFIDLIVAGSTSDEQKKDYAAVIQSSGKRLLRMIDDIVDMSLINANQLEIKRKMFPINPLMKEIYSTFSGYMNKKCSPDLTLRLSIPSEEKTATIFNDDIRIKQIFNSLLKNSLRFTRLGYIEIGYDIGNKITFFVKDTGEGMKDEQLTHLFYNRKNNGEETYTRKHGETSLGLTVIKRLTELMGGEMWVESELHKGTSVYFSLPGPVPEQTLKTLQHASPGKMLAAHDWSNKTILIAEDEELNFEFLKRLLSQTKVNIAWAENGQKAVDYFNNTPNINLVLMDIKMPVLNGIDATRIIKAKNKDIPVIAQTAYVHDENKKAIMAAGCDEFIPKPINTAFFISVLEKFLGN
ncbi:MAG TPA: response regulator [Bacteroidales bacterium]|nr:response regulator [Bacteroidales bacterium]